MYSDEDINDAVEAGVLDSKMAAAFRSFVATRRNGTLAGEEHFRLLTGFGDIFITLGILLVLIPAVWLSVATVSNSVGFLVGGAISWGLAEQFTRRRRKALPSIVLLLTFVGCSVLAVGYFLFAWLDPTAGSFDIDENNLPLWLLIPALAGGGAAYLHWSRFKVPITVAAGTVSLGLAAIVAVLSVNPENVDYLDRVIFVLGGFVFAFAIWWDASDTARITRRSDVAFWLHLCAAPMLVHPVFEGLIEGNTGAAEIAAVLVLYGGLVVLSLIIDRRALLVSAAAYVLFALSEILSGATGESLIAAFLAALVLGVALLSFSLFWENARHIALGMLPLKLHHYVPVVGWRVKQEER